MLIGEVLITLFAVGNAVWSVLNWRVQRRNGKTGESARGLLEEAQHVRDEACALFATATKACQSAVIEQEHKVCSECNRIVARHETDETGKTTCINCIAELAKA